MINCSNPTPNGVPVDFEPVTKKQMNFVDIRDDQIIAAYNPNHKFIQFWQNLYEKYSNIFTEQKIRDEL